MLTKRYTKATREETAVGVAHNVIGKAYLGQPFSDDELLEVVKHVEAAYGTFEERPDQFHAVVGAVALHAAKHADRYGPHGYDDEREVAGRSSMRYWIDNFFKNDMGAAYVARMAKLPPLRFELDVAPEPKSSARCCSGPGTKHRFGVGEPRLALALWEPGPMDTCTVVRERLVTCCLDAACVRKFEQEHRVSAADAVSAAHLGAEARVAVEARRAVLVGAQADGAPLAPPKPDACFPKDRKREPKDYESGENPWGKLELDIERVRAEAERRADEMDRVRAEQAPALDAADTKRAREAREAGDEDRKKRYRPTLDAHKDTVLDETNPLCAFVFERDPFGQPGPFKCPYDRKDGAPFCAQCAQVLEALCQA